MFDGMASMLPLSRGDPERICETHLTEEWTTPWQPGVTCCREGFGGGGERGSRSREERKEMDDQQVIGRINEIAHEEHELWEREGRGEITQAERERLQQLGVTLDQCWDLLHQRRARRAAGQDPDDTSVRDARTVEGYTS
jgi:hypothetical protein